MNNENIEELKKKSFLLAKNMDWGEEAIDVNRAIIAIDIPISSPKVINPSRIGMKNSNTKNIQRLLIIVFFICLSNNFINIVNIVVCTFLFVINY